MQWQWQHQSPAYANFGNANQWTVNAGLTSLARETAQNSNDARLGDSPADLVYTFIRLTGQRRRAFEQAVNWDTELRPHLEAMRGASRGAVSAGQLSAGLEALRTSPALVMLRIADHGCRGLAGPELAEGDESTYGDFIKLCRLDLYSGKDAAAGGSFGLGKAVYWRFSRLQTVLFNATVPPGAGVDGQTRNRVFGVQQGVVHRHDDVGYDGRGHFGVAPTSDEPVASHWGDDPLVASLHLSREDERPGTSALIVGFYDPDDPDSGLNGRRDLARLAYELRAGIEENFWPALARGRMRVRIDIEDDGERVFSERADAEETFTELVQALRRFDSGEVADSLDEPGAIVVREVPINVPRRTGSGAHPAFEHLAKLVVTLSDKVRDPLENKVCLVRRPEMVVETIDHTLEGRTYHAFLLAGAAKTPGDRTPEDIKADDFLRYAEPPAHDRWIPGVGRRQASQANLTGRYVAPWRRNLQGIEAGVRAALNDLFGPPLPPPDTAPESVLKHLRFLRSQSGTGGGRGTVGARKPTVTMDSGWVEDGRWVVDFTVRAQNRPEGWSFEPFLALVGLDGSRLPVAWDDPLEVLSREGEADDSIVVMRAKPTARVVRVTVRGVSVADLPIPASESAVEVVLRSLGAAPAGGQS